MKGYTPLVIFGCVHIGHRNADLSMAERYVKFVKENNGYALLLSDNFENVIPKKGHMMFDQILPPQDQLDRGEVLYAPIKKQILGLVQGNHSNRTRHEAGIDMDYQLAKHLGLKDKYNPNQGFTSVRAGKQVYSVAYRHGSGVGSNTFGNCINLLRAFPSADICAASHTHEIATTSKGFWEIVNGKRVRKDVVLVNTGSLLDFPSYADEAYYNPQRKGFAIVWLGQKEHKIFVDVSGEI